MQLEIEKVLRTKTCGALLNIDLEKAFDSVWVDGLLLKLNCWRQSSESRESRFGTCWLRNKNLKLRNLDENLNENLTLLNRKTPPSRDSLYNY